MAITDDDLEINFKILSTSLHEFVILLPEMISHLIKVISRVTY